MAPTDHCQLWVIGKRSERQFSTVRLFFYHFQQAPFFIHKTITTITTQQTHLKHSQINKNCITPKKTRSQQRHPSPPCFRHSFPLLRMYEQIELEYFTVLLDRNDAAHNARIKQIGLNYSLHVKHCSVVGRCTRYSSIPSTKWGES